MQLVKFDRFTFANELDMLKQIANRDGQERCDHITEQVLVAATYIINESKHDFNNETVLIQTVEMLHFDSIMIDIEELLYITEQLTDIFITLIGFQILEVVDVYIYLIDDNSITVGYKDSAEMTQ